jgi:hypothetical protein
VLRLQPTDDTFLTYQHHQIEVDDVEDENILEHFPAAIGFIQSGLNSGGGVLVHWLVERCHLSFLTHLGSGGPNGPFQRRPRIR